MSSCNQSTGGAGTSAGIRASRQTGFARMCEVGSRKLYAGSVNQLHRIAVIAPQHPYRARLKDLISRHGVPVAAMDLPAGWEQLAIWQENTP